VSSGVLDGDFYGHPKAIHAWGLHHSSIGVWALSVSYAHKNSTGGVVSAAFVIEKLPAKRERDAVIVALTSIAPGEENPLWTEVDGGWLIHNFGSRSEFRTPEQEEQLRQARSEAGRLGAAKRWQEVGNPDGNLPMAKQGVAISDKERKALTALKERRDVLSLCERLTMAMRRNDPRAHVAPDSRRWLDAARLLLDQDHRTVAEVERVIDWCQADEFWRSNILSMPKLREKFTQLSMKATAPAPTAERTTRKASNAAHIGGLLKAVTT